MELRKDPITRSWVRVGHREDRPIPAYGCPLCPGNTGDAVPSLLELASGHGDQVRVIPHFHPLYTIEGDVARAGDGIYDSMRPVGAHEIIIESRDHDSSLARMSDEQIDRVLQAYAMRIVDLKRDPRFKYVTVFENRGALAGGEWAHPYAQVTATMFVPRRVLYELRASREWYAAKERCVFCDIVRQDEKHGQRIVDTQGDYVALCPYASRVPFEVWVLSRKHNHLFEQPDRENNRRHLAVLLGRVLRRLTQISESYHLVLHTSPNTIHPRGELTKYWRTLAEDFHWHIEILPIVEQRSKSYSIKEVYFNSLLPEQAAQKLRELDAQLDPRVDPKIDFSTEGKLEAAGGKRDPKPDAKPDSKSGTKHGVKYGVRPQRTPEAKPASKPDTKT